MVSHPHRQWELVPGEAVNFLHCKCPLIPKETLTKVVDIVGGHFAHLIQASNMLNNTDPVTIKKRLFSTNIIKKLNLLKNRTPASKTGHTWIDLAWLLANKLLVAPDNMISFDDDELWQSLPEDEKKVLETAYLFDVDWIVGKITFQTNLAYTYFKEEIEKKEAGKVEQTTGN